MADETTFTPLAQNQIDPIPAADKPLDTLKANEQALDIKTATAGVDPTEPLSAAQRLRAFEDSEIGENAVRINGNIERGYGSRFKAMPEDKQRIYAALERLIVTEQELAEAETKYLQAGVDHDAALAAVAEAEHGSGE